jgi:hypothetical protein
VGRAAAKTADNSAYVATGFAAKGGFDHGYIGPIRASDDRTKDLDPGSNLVFLRTSTERTAFSATCVKNET